MSEVKTFSLVGNQYLAWDSPGGEERRFRVLLVLSLLIAFAISLAVEMTAVPKVDRRDAEKIPERLAKLVMEKKKEEPPPPPPKPEIKKEEEKPKEEKPPEPKPEKPTEVQVQKAREVATKAMAEAREELAAMQDMASAFDFGDAQPLTKAGSQTGGGISRDLIASRTGKGSGGVAIGPASSGGGGAGVAGGGKLAAVQVAKVESNIAEGAATGPTRKSASGKTERTEEEVRRIMDRNNGALQAIYQRALRTNPTLKGAVVMRIVIAADGSVSNAEMVSSELNDPETEKKLLTRIKAINFGAIEGVAVWDDKYTLNFFPS